MRPGGIGFAQAGQHPGQFGDPVLVRQAAYGTGRFTGGRHGGVDDQVGVGIRGDLR